MFCHSRTDFPQIFTRRPSTCRNSFLSKGCDRHRERGSIRLLPDIT
ncbi:hypothetical protein AG1IA_06466 [Rhizoctonia solani AG-1 IA]|uniref:Uncharacterized protein n=1 Tax=Thanatephorus cucumeris (strain AG1-IA) TaxID=983506 RepID=L8WRT1_THACA|nr:hypothetical protein AG1IA_06466 [Rhizoctonia solani AG-1 IA]